jgi:DNA helicase-2/ATP-dependent DNA helicase PcrA
METGIFMHYKSDTSIEGQARVQNIEELLNGVKNFVEEKHNEIFEEMQAEGEIADGVELAASDMPVVTLNDYIENVSLLSAVDVEDEDGGNNKISLMTVHSSKGLEYPYVFVAGMEENIFPSGGFLASESEIEEERRLCYVAMTRAKKVLMLSFAQTRMRNGKHESNSPSRFVREVDPKYIMNPLSASGDEDDSPRQSFGGWGSKPSFKPKTGNMYGQSSRPVIQKREPVRPVETKPITRPVVSPQQQAPAHTPSADFVPTPIMQLKAGQRIEHNRFGYGKIVEITGDVTDLKAKILFDNHGEKILLLKYAKIRTVNNC